MKKLLILSTALLLAGACSPGTDTQSNAKAADKAQAEQIATLNAEFPVWLDEKFMESAKRYPQFLARLGIKERMDEWNDPSRAFALETVDLAQTTLTDLRTRFDRELLTPENKLSFDLFEKNLQDTIEGYKWWDYSYPFNQMFGAQSLAPTFLANNHSIETIDDARAYIGRLNAIDAWMGTIVENSKDRAAQGILPPRFVYSHVLRDARNIITGLPFDENADELNIMLSDFKQKVDALDIDDATKSELYDSATTALLTSVGPAYQNMIAELQAQQSQATADDGVWKLPNGEAYYAYQLGQMTTTDLTADEIHNIGLQDVERIHSEMRDIMAKVGFEGDLQDFFTFLKTDPQFVFEDSDAGRDAYLADATAMIDTMKTRIDDYFLKKPKADLVVRRVEAFREQSAGKAFYNRPSQDGTRPGIYYANLYKITDMPKYQMEALAYHEGIPGHHMQLAIAQELEGVPMFQKFGSVTAYTEGWGLYSEYLPKEMGFYEDPYSDFGRLAMELWRAARLVVDTGLHSKKWTREEAIDYLIENTPNPENDCIKAIERYIVMPGQATAYKIGMIKILELRETAKTALGDNFDIREFHDVVLETGPVPLDMLEDRIETWIASKS